MTQKLLMTQKVMCQLSQPLQQQGLIEKGLLFPRKMLVCGWNLPYLEVNGIYTNDHSPHACTIPTF